MDETFGNIFEDSIKRAVEKRVVQILEEEIETAMKKLRERLVREADHLALSVLKLYSVEDFRSEIRITVKKEIE